MPSQLAVQSSMDALMVDNPNLYAIFNAATYDSVFQAVAEHAQDQFAPSPLHVEALPVVMHYLTDDVMATTSPKSSTWVTVPLRGIPGRTSAHAKQRRLTAWLARKAKQRRLAAWLARKAKRRRLTAWLARRAEQRWLTAWLARKAKQRRLTTWLAMKHLQ